MRSKTKKLIWAVPLIAVVAVIGALALFVAQTPNSALAHDPPGAVTDLALKVESQTEIKLSWKAPTTGGMVDSYRIDKSKDALAWTLLTDSAPGDMQTYSDTTVEQGELRYYRVFAVNSAGIGPVSEVEGEQTSGAVGPGPVTGLRAVPAAGNDGRTQIVLTWSAPAKTGGSPIVGYRVFYQVARLSDGTVPTDGTQTFENLDDGATPPVPTAPVDEGGGSDNKIIGTDSAATTFTHKTLTHPATNTGLLPNTTYRYKVVAVNKAGQVSATAPEVRGATTKKVGNPSTPTGLTAVATGSTGEIQLYWYHPADNGGATITHFFVHQKAPTESWPDADTPPSDAQVTEVSAPAASGADTEINATISSGLTDGTAYQFRVYAMHGNALNTASTRITSLRSGSSNTASGTPAATQSVPAAPSIASDSLEGDRDAKGVVTLTWERPTTGTDQTILSYRIDVSDDGYKWDKLIESTSFTKGEYRYKDPKRGDGIERHYRLFARNRHGFSSASEILTVGVETANPPGLVRNLTATADTMDPTKIHITWDAPSDDGGADLVGYCVDYAVTTRPAVGTTFDVQALLAQPTNAAQCADTDPKQDVDPDSPAADDATGGRVKIEVKVPETGNPNPPTSYTVEKLQAQDTVQFRVVANNLSVTDVRMYGPITSADTVIATTVKAARPNAPEDLTVEAARDSNLGGTSNRGVNLLWNAPSEAGLGVTIDGYHIQVSTDGGMTWTDVEDDTGDLLTYYTHDSEPAADEVRMYRVAAIDDQATTDESLWSNEATYPYSAMYHDPGMPTAVMAEKDAAMPTSQIKVSWSAPASGIVDGYIIERRYGDMMAIPSDGYSGENGANRMHAFMDYKEWWETLNCKGMLAVAGSSADPAVDSDDKAMYCKHFANTAPTNMAFEGMTVSDETAEKIKHLFEHRYVSDDMGMTMTMFTGMMYTDMNLMDGTEYTYRVRAIHGMKAGPWSAAAMATTDSANTAPMMVDPPPFEEPLTKTVSLTAGGESWMKDLTGYYEDAEGDDLSYSASVMPDDNSIATASVSGVNVLTIAPVAAGDATVTLTVSDGELSVTHEIAVTVMRGALRAPMLTATPGAGSVTLEWDRAGAMEYTVAAMRSDGTAVQTTSDANLIWMPDVTETSYEVTDLFSNAMYFFAVAACGNEDCTTYEWSEVKVVTTN